MRADRLLSLVMLLQTRGNMTAQALGEELEVSERTIYRDVEALSFAGIPVYAERGPGGGIALLDSYRTSLTGLNRDEVRALFMLSIPAPLDELGVTADLKAALLKLSAALPAVGRDEQIMARQRIHLDSVAWSQPEQPVPTCRSFTRLSGRTLSYSCATTWDILARLSCWLTLLVWSPRPRFGTWFVRAKITCGCCACPIFSKHVLLMSTSNDRGILTWRLTGRPGASRMRNGW